MYRSGFIQRGRVDISPAPERQGSTEEGAAVRNAAW